jgi:hypothetical protein
MGWLHNKGAFCMVYKNLMIWRIPVAGMAWAGLTVSLE